jgi:hypothetical protein
MKVTPKTEKEIAESNLWQPAEYGFEILDATDEVSKSSGAEMIKMKVAVYNGEGEQRIVFDYLLDSMAHKVRHAADCCGLLDKYEAGTLMADDFKGKNGYLKLRIQKDKTGAYPDKNVIADYVVGKSADAPAANVNGKGKVSAPIPDDSSIPF